jgi:hypothetical protein
MPATRSLLSLSSLFVLLVLVLAAAPSARAQLSVNQAPPVYTGPGMTGNTSFGTSPMMRLLYNKMAGERNDQRQQKIVSDSARLLVLAQKFNAEVAASGKNQLTASLVKEAREIEKLAKSVKDNMRYSY